MRYLLGKEKRHRPPAAQVEGALPPHFRRRVYAAKGRWLGFCPPPMLPAPTSCDCSAVDASSCKRLGASCCQRCLGTASAVSNCTEPVYPQRPLAAWLRGARRGRCSNRHRRSGSPLPIAAAATLFSAEQRHTCVNGSEGAWFPSRHFTQSWARLAAFCLASCARFASTRQTLRTDTHSARLRGAPTPMPTVQVPTLQARLTIPRARGLPLARRVSSGGAVGVATTARQWCVEPAPRRRAPRRKPTRWALPPLSPPRVT